MVFLLFCPAKRNLFAPVLLEYKIIYPDEARQMGLEGKVFLGVLINENGRVEQARIVKSSTSPILDSAALETARTFVFSPALMGNRAIRIWANLPVEFKFEEVKPGQWLQEVISLQSMLEKEYKEEKVMELYKLYKKLIFSPRKTIDITINDYIRNAVLTKTATLWDGYWKMYPATPILFIDIMYRYPESYASFEAGEEFKEYFEREIITIRAMLSSNDADTLITRLNRSVGR
ncbi:MAG: energy transducer TonB [candidate division WOR-3 bacterium]